MSNGDAQFAEFFVAAWARVYRTTYAVAGWHGLTQDAVQDAFADAYLDWTRVSDSGNPESQVATTAIEAVLTVFRKAPEQDSPSEFGPLIPQGNLITTSLEERSRVNDLWAELQSLDPSDRAVVSLSAATGSPIYEVGGADDLPSDRHLVDFLVTHLDEVQIPRADLELVISQGSARRRRRRWFAGAVAAALIALVAIPIALFAPEDKAPAANSVGSWREAAESPLTPRWSSLATWTGSEALFIGGNSQESCVEQPTCQGLRDGAAYNPETNTWRPIARAPFPMVAFSPHAQVGDQLYVTGPRWVRYDATEDEWTELPPPPRPAFGGTVAAVGDSIYTVGPRAKDAVQVFDGATDRWSVLPANPATPRLRYRNLVGTTQGLVVLGINAEELRAELYVPGQWRVYPEGVKGGHSLRWSWTGERLIHAEIVAVYGADGERDGARFAGGLTLNPDSGEWGYLPVAQATPGAEPWKLFAESGAWVAADGYVYDDRDASWATVVRPAQAPKSAVASVWADGRLIAFGGANFTGTNNDTSGSTNRLWIYTPKNPEG